MSLVTIISNRKIEFTNKFNDLYFVDNDIQYEYSAIITPQQNGVAQRKNMTPKEATRRMVDE